uniref:hypothetical protein n=1 Tax=Cupriavidus necator TaxID=106590 RepID=UPI003F49AB2A
MQSAAGNMATAGNKALPLERAFTKRIPSRYTMPDGWSLCIGMAIRSGVVFMPLQMENKGTMNRCSSIGDWVPSRSSSFKTLYSLPVRK